jgi:hypothetical protein
MHMQMCGGEEESGPKPRRSVASFCHLFFAMSLCLICFHRDRPSQL